MACWRMLAALVFALAAAILPTISFPRELNATVTHATTDGSVYETCDWSLSVANNASYCDYSDYIVATYLTQLIAFNVPREYLVLGVGDYGQDLECLTFPPDVPVLEALVPALAAFAYNGTMTMDDGGGVPVLATVWTWGDQRYFANAATGAPLAWLVRPQTGEWKNYSGATAVAAWPPGLFIAPLFVSCVPG